MIILYGIVASFIFWLMFIMVANLKNNSYKNATGVKRYALLAYGIVFIIVDVVFNFVYGALIFKEFGSFDRPTLTQRLKHILENEPDNSYKYKLASFVCRKMIEPWDWNHCGLAKIN